MPIIALTNQYPVFYTIIVQLSLSIRLPTAGIHNSLLFQLHKPEVSDFIFKFLLCF